MEQKATLGGDEICQKCNVEAIHGGSHSRLILCASVLLFPPAITFCFITQASMHVEVFETKEGSLEFFNYSTRSVKGLWKVCRAEVSYSNASFLTRVAL